MAICFSFYLVGDDDGYVECTSGIFKGDKCKTSSGFWYFAPHHSRGK